MAAPTIESILGLTPLNGMVQAIKTGIPNPLPPELFSNPRPTVGDAGSYTRFTGTRKTARRTEFGAAPTRSQLSPVGSFPVKLIHSAEEIELPMVTYQRLRDYNNYTMQNMGKNEADRQAKQFVQRFVNHRIAATQLVLSSGQINHNSGGELLLTSSGAANTVDYAVPAGNQAQLNWDGNGAIIGASWDLTTTDIPGHLRQLEQASTQLTGYVPKIALYGINIPSYIAKNDYVKSWFGFNPVANQYWLNTGQIPQGFLGIERWIPVYNGFFESEDGTRRQIWGDDQITFLPEVNEDWWEFMEGTYPVPTSIDLLRDMEAAHSNFNAMQGMFGLAFNQAFPPTLKMIYGDTYLPILKVPSAIWIADVTP